MAGVLIASKNLFTIASRAHSFPSENIWKTANVSGSAKTAVKDAAKVFANDGAVVDTLGRIIVFDKREKLVAHDVGVYELQHNRHCKIFNFFRLFRIKLAKLDENVLRYGHVQTTVTGQAGINRLSVVGRKRVAIAFVDGKQVVNLDVVGQNFSFGKLFAALAEEKTSAETLFNVGVFKLSSFSAALRQKVKKDMRISESVTRR